MELHARLVHLETGLRVVEMRATAGEICLGSALGEAATVQEAEDLALARLLQRLNRPPTAGQSGRRAEPRPIDEPPLAPAPAVPAAPEPISPPRPPAHPAPSVPSTAPPRDGTSRPTPPPRRLNTGRATLPADPWTNDPEPAAPEAAVAPTEASAPPGPPEGEPVISPSPQPPPLEDPETEPPADPEDWSQELAALELQLRRLGWGREQEGSYLQRAFGHPSRSRLTRYSDLRAYLQALEGLERGSDPAVAPVPLRRSELLAQGDALLASLGWSAEQGRAFLERELQRVSRQQLSDVQLLQFNMLLEGELMASASPVADPGDAPAWQGPEALAASTAMATPPPG